MSASYPPLCDSSSDIIEFDDSNSQLRNSRRTNAPRGAMGWQRRVPGPCRYYVELEELLGFIQGHNRLNSFWPRLTSPRPQERDDALQEMRVARFLTAKRFPV